tara:strand:- start:6006 stop:6632 length:627 start_codon:yes stop_codon:yes gene_type:complete
MNNFEIINKTELFANENMNKYDESHNFSHALRVKNLATKIAIDEKLNDDEVYEIILASLVHDINDHKYNSEEDQESKLKEFFSNLLEPARVDRVVYLACNVSLSKEVELANANTKCISYNLDKQLICIRDADRIESLGSMGIIRYIIYGTVKINSNIDTIIKNIEDRTMILMQNIKTNMGKKISSDKYTIIKIFIDDYYKTIHNYHNY